MHFTGDCSSTSLVSPLLSEFNVVQGKSRMVVCDLHGLTQDAKMLLFRASLLSICEGGICVLTINKLFVRASNSCRTMFKKYLWSTAKRKVFNAGVQSRIENRYSPRILIEKKNSEHCLEIIIIPELLNTEARADRSRTLPERMIK